MGITEDFGERVRDLRRRHHLTQAELAEMTALTPGQVSRIELGAREPRFATVERIARALGVEIRDLFDRNADVPRKPPSVSPAFAGLEELDPKAARAVAACLRSLARVVQQQAKRKK